VPDNCPVTKPWIQVYVPPPPYSPETDPSLFWYRAMGRIALLHSCRPVIQALKVTGRRLDAPALRLAADRASDGWVHPDQPFMVVGINFPTLGCWEVTGRYRHQELTFVVWVASRI
jgi:hypothetical protein